MQTKKDSHIEIWTNQIVGIIIGLVVMYFLIPAIEDLPPEIKSPVVVFTMFMFSYIRAFGLRRYFNKRINNETHDNSRQKKDFKKTLGTMRTL